MWFDQLMVIILCLVPVWILIIGRIKEKNWVELDNKFYNSSFKPPPVKKTKSRKTSVKIPKYNRNNKNISIAFGLIGIVLLFLFKSDKYAPGLDLNRNKAISIAEKYLVDNGVDLGDDFSDCVDLGSILVVISMISVIWGRSWW